MVLLIQRSTTELNRTQIARLAYLEQLWTTVQGPSFLHLIRTLKAVHEQVQDGECWLSNALSAEHQHLQAFQLAGCHLQHAQVIDPKKGLGFGSGLWRVSIWFDGPFLRDVCMLLVRTK